MKTEEILAAIQKSAEKIAEPNCADILSVVFSFLAIVVAGVVAWRQNKISKQQADISEQQNKIAVFDKRYDLYDTVLKCISLSEFIFTLFEGKVITTKDVHLLFAIAFKDVSDNAEDVNVFQEASRVCSKLKQSEFLFSENVSIYLSKLSESLLCFILADAPANQNKSLSILKEDYCQVIKNLKTDGILQKMKKDLCLTTPN